MILLLSCVQFVSWCDNTSGHSDAYLEFESYVAGYFEDQDDSYGHESHLLFDKPTRYTVEYLVNDELFYEGGDYGNDGNTVSLLPMKYDSIVNEHEYLYEYQYTDYRFTDDSYIQTYSPHTAYYSQDHEISLYVDSGQTTKDYDEDFSLLAESVTSSNIKYNYTSYSTYDEYLEDYSDAAYNRATYFSTSQAKYFYNDIFDYSGNYICTENVTKEGDVISFYFTRQYYDATYYVYEGTLDLTTGKLDYTEEGTSLNLTYSYVEGEYEDYYTYIVEGFYFRYTKRHTLSFSDEGFDIGFDTEKDYQEMDVTDGY